jgi:hypothetical protein
MPSMLITRAPKRSVPRTQPPGVRMLPLMGWVWGWLKDSFMRCILRG